MKPVITGMTFSSSPARKKPAAGDVRFTKKHGRQIRVPVYVHDHQGRRTGRNFTGGRQNYEWVALTEENLTAHSLGHMKFLLEEEE